MTKREAVRVLRAWHAGTNIDGQPVSLCDIGIAANALLSSLSRPTRLEREAEELMSIGKAVWGTKVFDQWLRAYGKKAER